MLLSYSYLVLNSSGPVAGLTPVILTAQTLPGNVAVTTGVNVYALGGGLYHVTYDPESTDGEIAVLVDNGNTITDIHERYRQFQCNRDRSRVLLAINDAGKTHAALLDDKDGYGLASTGLNHIAVEAVSLPTAMQLIAAAVAGSATRNPDGSITYNAVGNPATPRIVATANRDGSRPTVVYP